MKTWRCPIRFPNVASGRWHPKTCRTCGKTARDGVTISASGLCPEHSHERFEANLDQLRAQRGPFAQWWAYKLAEGVGYAPLDGVPPRP